MKVHLEGVIPAIQWYLDFGWKVDYFPEAVDNVYAIYSPAGSVFREDDLRIGFCPFCNEDSPDWEENFCNHSQGLLDEESNARNLLSLLLLEPSLQYKNLQ